MAQILIIEDDDNFRQLLAAGLKKAGHAITEARDGHEGLAKIREQVPDLILTDIVMPQQDGIETISALKKEFPAVPIIAMSGESSHSRVYLQVASHLGAGHVLPKPFTRAVLLKTVDAVLAGVKPAAASPSAVKTGAPG